MKRILAQMFIAAACGAVPLAAHAQAAYAAKAVNMRAGPGRDYPVVTVVAGNVPLAVQGCVNGYTWCDVVAGPYRGWVYAGNIDYAYNGQYVPLLSNGPELGIAIVGFTLLDYWNRYYTHEPFYGQRDTWAHRAPPARRPPAMPRGRVQPRHEVAPQHRAGPQREAQPQRGAPAQHGEPPQHGGARPMARMPAGHATAQARPQHAPAEQHGGDAQHRPEPAGAQGHDNAARN